MRYVLFAALLLAGCASRAEREARLAAADSARCESLGFKPGTEAFGGCRLQIMQLREQRDMAASARYSNWTNTYNATGAAMERAVKGY
jgi:hypothetical protein